MNITILRIPPRCRLCRMFGHNVRSCHTRPTGYQHFQHLEIHNRREQRWREEQSVPDDFALAPLRVMLSQIEIDRETREQQSASDYMGEKENPKTQFEVACEADCKVIPADNCCICMEALGEKNRAVTPCGHQFHYGCLCQVKSTQCPVCRGVFKPDGVVSKRKLRMPSQDAMFRAVARSIVAHDTYLRTTITGELSDQQIEQLLQIFATMALQQLRSYGQAIEHANE